MTNRLPTYTSRRFDSEDAEQSNSSEDDSFINKINDQATSLVRNHTVISITIGIALGATLGWLIKRK